MAKRFKKSMYKFRYPRKLKKQLQKKNKKLIARYPFLMVRNVWTGKEVSNFDYTWNRIESGVYPGWWKRFGISLCEDLREVLLKHGYLDEYFITDVKEKYGSIRIYDYGAPEEWHDHLYAWEYISMHTCHRCGKFPVATLDDGWVLAWCENCYKAYDRGINTRMRNEHESVDFTKLRIDDKWDGRVQEYISYMTYKEGEEITHYIDMKPFYDKIGWKYSEKDLISKEEMTKNIIKEKGDYLKI